jgi:hypothetical protein
MLSDGTILPDYIRPVKDRRSGFEQALNDMSLRVGQIKAVYAPNDPGNNNGKFYEYDVKVDYTDGISGLSKIIYPNCRTGTLFGGVGDFLRVTPRPLSQANPDPRNLDNGWKVLLLCVNDSRKNAIIIGGYPHANMTADDPSLGHNLHFNFNGIDAKIDDSGQITLTYNGKTQLDGTPDPSVNPISPGTMLQIANDGSFKLVTPGSNQSVTIDNTQNQINLQASLGGFLVNTATDAFIKGTTYRAAETEMHTQQTEAITQLSTQLAQVSLQLIQASVALQVVSNLFKIPVAGPKIAQQPMQQASQAIQQAAQTLGQTITPLGTIIESIDTFEAAAVTYLTLIHKIGD